MMLVRQDLRRCSHPRDYFEFRDGKNAFPRQPTKVGNKKDDKWLSVSDLRYFLMRDQIYFRSRVKTRVAVNLIRMSCRDSTIRRAKNKSQKTRL